MSEYPWDIENTMLNQHTQPCDCAVCDEIHARRYRRRGNTQSQLRTLAEAVLHCHVSEVYTEDEDGHNNKARLQFRGCQCPACQLAREIMEVGNAN